MGLFNWLFGNKEKSDEEKMREISEHLEKERAKSIPKHRGNKHVRLQPRVVSPKKEKKGAKNKAPNISQLRVNWVKFYI